MQNILAIFLGCSLVFSLNTAWSRSDTPLPEATVLESTDPTADSAFWMMQVSHAYMATHKTNVRTGVNFAQFHVNELAYLTALSQRRADIAKPAGIPPIAPLPPGARLKKVFAYYGLGAPKLVEEILRAREQGLEIEIMTDLNQSLVGQFAQTTISTDFVHAGIKDTEPGRALVNLVRNGFTVNGDSGSRILTQPLFNTKVLERIPIFHLKETFTILVHPDGREEPLYMTSGTANMNETAPRFNRMFTIVDRDLVPYSYNHYLSMAKNFLANGSISDIESVAPIKKIYKDGTSVQVSYTDGKYDPYEVLSAALAELAKTPEENEVLDVLLSEFVFTNTDILARLQEVMEAHPNAHLNAIFDQKFLNIWGVPRVLEGIDAYRPFGRALRGFPFAARMRKAEDGSWQDRVNTMGWLRVAPGRVVRDVDGVPLDVELWHDKTRVVKFLNKALEKIAFIVNTGSFNLSNNHRNQEVNYQMHMNDQSWVAPAIQESVTAVVSQNMDAIVPGDIVFFLEELSRMLGIGYHEMGEQRAKDILNLIMQEQFHEAKVYLLAIGRGRTHLDEKLFAETLTHRVEILISFLTYYSELVKSLRPGEFTKFINGRTLPPLLKIFWNEELSPSQIKFILGGYFWPFTAKKDEPTENPNVRTKDSYVREVWDNILNIRANFDEKLPRRGDPNVVRIPENPEAGFHRIEARIFDWDNTIAHMRTKIYVFDRDNHARELALSTEEYARRRHEFEDPNSKWMTLHNRPDGGSFRDFMDPNKNPLESPFVQEIAHLLEHEDPETWSAPLLEAFIESLATEELARWTYIVTALGHHPNSILEGIKRLKVWLKLKRGITIYVPPIENIFPVSHPDFATNPNTNEQMRIQEAKAFHIFAILEAIKSFVESSPQYGLPKAIFSDDDVGNVHAAIRDWQEQDPQKYKTIRFFQGVYAEHILLDGRLTRFRVRATGDTTYREYLISEMDEDPDAKTLGFTLEQVISEKASPIGAARPQTVVMHSMTCAHLWVK